MFTFHFNRGFKLAPLILNWLARLIALRRDKYMPHFKYELTESKFWFICSLCKREIGPMVLDEVYKSPKETLLNAAKAHLARCPECLKWVCIDCWNPSTKSCKACLKNKKLRNTKKKFLV
jgi:hypothetical protein